MSIALTFDDGPNQTTTLELLDFLEKEHVTATFFVLGNMVQKSPAVLKRIANSPLGHQIGNHSWSHPDFKTLDDAQVNDEINRTQELIENTVGASLVRIMRPPYGSITKSQRELVKNMGYDIVLWTVDSCDTKKNFPRQAKPIADQILKDTHQGSVVLVHDIHKYSVEAIKIVIPELKKHSCSFATVRLVKTQAPAVLCTY
jgi:peptidoglycan/xylan/chitin deacetylase (PgdA/CDA1 family)